MNQAARRLGRSLALVLPVLLVLSGTLAVARVPWADPPEPAAVLPAGTERAEQAAEEEPVPVAPQDALRDRLIAELQQADPSIALTSLQLEMDRQPSLSPHCGEIARALGRAAVEFYGAEAAQQHARPVCDTSFAAGVGERSATH